MNYNCDINFNVLELSHNNFQSIIIKHCFKYNYQFVVRKSTDFKTTSKKRKSEQETSIRNYIHSYLN